MVCYFKEASSSECYSNIHVMFWITIFVMTDEILVNDYYKLGWDCASFATQFQNWTYKACTKYAFYTWTANE